MTLDEIPRPYRETWAAYEAFRKLGFKDEHITHHAAPVMLPDGKMSTDPWFCVVLAVQGKRFTVTVAPLDRPFAEARELLERVRCAIGERRVSDADLERMWAESKMGDVTYFTAFGMAVVAKGFFLPALVS